MFEKDPTIKKNLLLAEQIISAVNTELVANLTKIASEACGTCSQITQAVNDAINAIESTIAKADPDWKNNPIFKAVVAAIQSILDLVKAICPNEQLLVSAGTSAVPLDNCLTPQQQQQLKTATKTISAVLNTADAALKVAAMFEKDPTIKKNLLLAEQIISAVNTELVANLTKIASEACGTCSQITQAVNDAINAIESTIAKADPDWKNNPIFKAVVAAIQSILDLVKAICPDTPAVLQSTPKCNATTEYCSSFSGTCVRPKNIPCSQVPCDAGFKCDTTTELCIFDTEKPCDNPCQKTSFCCPDTKQCAAPVLEDGNTCKTNDDCDDKRSCCPLTSLCVELGKSCLLP